MKESYPPLTIRLFGPFDARRGETPLPPLRTRKGQWLLALLALRAPRALSREWLAATLWPDSLEGQALAGLRRALTDLRRALGPDEACIQAPTARSLAFQSSLVIVDTHAFDTAVTRKEYARSVSLYRGPLLEDCAEEWTLTERAQRQEDYLRCRTALASEALQEQDFAAAAEHWQAITNLDPLREAAQRGLMEALMHQGDLAAAVQVYRELRQRLREEFDAEPGPTTTRLFQELRHDARAKIALSPLKQVFARAAARPAVLAPHEALTEPQKRELPPAPLPVESLPTAPVPPHRLPRPLTPFIGRERESRALRRIIPDHRLVTLTGAGGIGKTRLALAAAEQLLNSENCPFPEGIFFIDLAPLTEGELLPRVIAGALQIAEAPEEGFLSPLCATLQNRRLLLVLDNCEHLLESVARIADRLLSSCPSVHLLTTSREPLKITGEAVFRVSPLSRPPAEVRITRETCMEYEALRLFLERAMAVQPELSLTPEALAAAVRICERLDGLALALELAAARLSVLSLDQVARRLDDRFRLLTGGSRTALPRHRTLKATLDWSFELLSPSEQSMLARLSVFVGGFNLQTARAVCLPESSEDWEALDLLSALVDKSLVTPLPCDRYRLTETVRDYASEQLRLRNEGEATGQRFVDTISELTRRMFQELRSGDAEIAVTMLGVEQDNIRATLQMLLAQPQTALIGQRLAHLMARFWTMRNALSEAELWCQKALQAPLDPGISREEYGPARVRLLGGAGVIARRQGDYARARCLQERSLELSQAIGDKDGIAAALGNLALLADNQGDYERSQELREQGLALERERGDNQQIAAFLHNSANLAQRLGDYSLAYDRFVECLTLQRQVGDQEGIAWALLGLADVLTRDDRERALSLREEALAIAREIGDIEAVVYGLSQQSLTLMEIERLEASAATLAEALTLLAEMEGNSAVLEPVQAAAELARYSGELARTAELEGYISALMEWQSTRPTPREAADREARHATLRQRLGEAGFRSAYERGSGLSLEDGIALARKVVTRTEAG